MNNEKTIKNLTILLLVFLPIIWNPFGFDVFALPRAAFLYLMGGIILILMLADGIKGKWRRIKADKSKVNFFLLLFLFFILISFVFSRDKYTAFWGYSMDYEGALSWFFYFVLFYAGYFYFSEAKSLKKLFSFLTLPLFAVGTYAVAQYFYGWQLMEWFQKTEIRRASSFLGHPSYLGLYCVLLLPLVFSLIRKNDRSSRKKIFFYLSFTFGFFALILSFSRGAWLAFMVMVCVFALMNFKLWTSHLETALKFFKNPLPLFFKGGNYGFLVRGHNDSSIARVAVKKIKTRYIAVFAAVLLLAAAGIAGRDFIVNVGQRFLSIFNVYSSSIRVRMYLYAQSSALIKDNWLFGIGPDNFPFIISRYFSPSWDVFRAMTADKAHNQILDYWISFGIGGIMSYFLFLFYWFKNVSKKMWKMGKTEKNLLTGMILSSLGYLTAMQFHYSTIDLAPFFFFFLGAGLSLSRSEEIIEVEEDYHKKDGNKIFLYFSIISVIIIFYFTSRKISADYMFANGLREKDGEKAVDYFEHAVKKNSHSTNYYLTLNDYYIEKGEHTKDNLYFQKALDILIEAAEKIPLDYRITYQLGETYLKIAPYAANDDYVYAQAENAYKKTLEFYPNFSDAHLKAGVVFAHLGKDEQALSSWNKCVELKKTNAECYYNLSVLYKKRGETREAKKNYDKYLEAGAQSVVR